MHFSIPDTQELIDSTGNSYLGYNIHVNGLYHCTVRYKQLFNLHEQLLKDKDINSRLPQFPPKKFFPLTVIQQEDRRAGLEKYIQIIGQNSLINNSELLNGFLFHAQIETNGKLIENDDINDVNIYLMNSDKVMLNISSNDNTKIVLNKLLRKLNLPNQYDIYFNLYITVDDDDGNIVNVLRKLQNFESPLLTFNNINYNNDVKIVLGKDYWDIDNDLALIDNSIGLHLLYIQAISEINRGWILIPQTKANVIMKLREKSDDSLDNNEKVKLFNLIRTFKYYGYTQFAMCHCDYPNCNTKVIVSIGRNELNLRIYNENNEENEEVFKVTRMRCWRITTLPNNPARDDQQQSNDQHISNYSLELSFEYLIAKDNLQWITISSDQAILMSVCIQNMVDELLLNHKIINKLPTTSKPVNDKQWTYLMRDGNTRIIFGSNSNPNSSDIINNKVQTHHQEQDNSAIDERDHHQNEPGKSNTDLLQIISGKFLNNKNNKKVIDKVNIIKSNSINNCDVMENNAFHMFGDDDL